MAEDVVLGVAEAAGVVVVEDEADDSDITIHRCILSTNLQENLLQIFLL